MPFPYMAWDIAGIGKSRFSSTQIVCEGRKHHWYVCFCQNNAQISLSKRNPSIQCHPYRAGRPASEISCATLRRSQRFPEPHIRFVDGICTNGGGKNCRTGPPYLVLNKFRFYHHNFDQNSIASDAVSRIIDFSSPQTFVSRLRQFFFRASDIA